MVAVSQTSGSKRIHWNTTHLAWSLLLSNHSLKGSTIEVVTATTSSWRLLALISSFTDFISSTCLKPKKCFLLNMELCTLSMTWSVSCNANTQTHTCSRSQYNNCNDYHYNQILSAVNFMSVMKHSCFQNHTCGERSALQVHL